MSLLIKSGELIRLGNEFKVVSLRSCGESVHTDRKLYCLQYNGISI